jgi:TFIIF-interacting CTD phosphatase-like protein
VYVKDLMILLEGRRLEDMVIVDNKIESYASNLENGIPITDFLG